jgi:hypothetical protein
VDDSESVIKGSTCGERGSKRHDGTLGEPLVNAATHLPDLVDKDPAAALEAFGGSTVRNEVHGGGLVELREVQAPLRP